MCIFNRTFRVGSTPMPTCQTGQGGLQIANVAPERSNQTERVDPPSKEGFLLAPSIISADCAAAIVCAANRLNNVPNHVTAVSTGIRSSLQVCMSKGCVRSGAYARLHFKLQIGRLAIHRAGKAMPEASPLLFNNVASLGVGRARMKTARKECAPFDAE